jgi:hypothetical protein
MSNFRTIDRQTGFLLPPSVDEWLPEKHLARFVVEDDPGSGNDDAGPEHVGNARDQGNSIAIAIDDHEVRRVSIDSARRRIIERTVSFDQAAAPAAVLCEELNASGFQGSCMA